MFLGDPRVLETGTFQMLLLERQVELWGKYPGEVYSLKELSFAFQPFAPVHQSLYFPQAFSICIPLPSVRPEYTVQYSAPKLRQGF